MTKNAVRIWALPKPISKEERAVRQAIRSRCREGDDRASGHGEGIFCQPRAPQGRATYPRVSRYTGRAAPKVKPHKKANQRKNHPSKGKLCRPAVLASLQVLDLSTTVTGRASNV
jgi:hypothetical protein